MKCSTVLGAQQVSRLHSLQHVQPRDTTTTYWTKEEKSVETPLKSFRQSEKKKEKFLMASSRNKNVFIRLCLQLWHITMKWKKKKQYLCYSWPHLLTLNKVVMIVLSPERKERKDFLSTRTVGKPLAGKWLFACTMAEKTQLSVTFEKKTKTKEHDNIESSHIRATRQTWVKFNCSPTLQTYVHTCSVFDLIACSARKGTSRSCFRWWVESLQQWTATASSYTQHVK